MLSFSALDSSSITFFDYVFRHSNAPRRCFRKNNAFQSEIRSQSQLHSTRIRYFSPHVAQRAIKRPNPRISIFPPHFSKTTVTETDFNKQLRHCHSKFRNVEKNRN